MMLVRCSFAVLVYEVQIILVSRTSEMHNHLAILLRVRSSRVRGTVGRRLVSYIVEFPNNEPFKYLKESIKRDSD